MICYNNLKIQIIDDSAEDRFLIKKYLDSAFDKDRVTIFESDCGKSSLELFTEVSPDCVILDYCLPDLSGLEVLISVRKINPKTPIIFITSQGDEDVATNAFLNGADHYLSKSTLSADHLYETIHQVMLKAANLKPIKYLEGDEVINAVAHEFKSPINTITVAAELLKITNLNKEQNEYVGVLKEASQMLINVSDRVFNLFRVQHRHDQLSIEEFNFTNAFKGYIRFLSYSVSNHNVILKHRLDTAIPELLLGDFFLVKEILSNITNNALKFTNSGSILVSAKLLSQHKRSVMIRFKVKDTGIGIPPEQVSGIFGKFIQANEQVSKTKGIGLGLFICKSITELLGGSISVSSKVGAGTIFIIDIPFETVV
ncbi:MAG: hybrid sensor histidine kinase/response regulator [Lentisphaeraceae bacterium]|nr:hybrid sensor histidine kinase/response regulator [Lentisphaeraceae bacterium]